MKKNKGCKLICMMLVLAMLLGLLAGCASGGGEATKPSTTESTGGDVPETTKPNTSDPEATEPIGTEPADPGVTEPSEPVVTEPGEATEPTDVTDPSEPEATEPAETTEPTTSVPTEPGHKHGFEAEVVNPTCTKDGYTLYFCDCGNSFISDKVPATGHKYGEWKTTKEPTEAADGAAERICSTCGGKETKVLDKLVPNHNHSYTSKVTKAATCTKDGVKTYTCACGSSYTETIAKTGHKYGEYKSNADFTCMENGTKTAVCSVCGAKDTVVDYDSAMGHDHLPTSVVEPTMWAEGYTIYTCYNCGNELKRNYTDKIPQEEFERMVAEAVVKYINQFRVEQGDTVATSLPGLTLVAEYRAVQLQDNFEHSFAASREAFAYYEYGEYHDMTQYGYDESYNYWSANAKEAIAARSKHRGTPDQIGEKIARQFLGSANHWAYVGSSDFSYIGVGISYNENAASGYCWHCCVLQTSNNYG